MYAKPDQASWILCPSCCAAACCSALRCCVFLFLEMCRAVPWVCFNRQPGNPALVKRPRCPSRVSQPALTHARGTREIPGEKKKNTHHVAAAFSRSNSLRSAHFIPSTGREIVPLEHGRIGPRIRSIWDSDQVRWLAVMTTHNR